MGTQQQLKRFRKELRKKEKEMFNTIMDAIKNMPLKERLRWAWKIVRKRC